VTAKTIDTDKVSADYRRVAVDVAAKRLLVTNFHGTSQEKDFSVPSNCRGYGRVHHFRRSSSGDWPENPLPIDPACRALGLPRSESVRAQVFQNAVCNWRCWYCFVDFKLLSANRKFSEWLSAETLVDMYLAETDRAPIIDLSGGQPDLTPEWVVWTMTALRARGVEKQVYLWSDDNLSNDYFWRFLSEEDREVIASYAAYGRVCCFKGFDADSFSFNTRAEPALFARQFDLMRRLLTTGIDLYAYVTLTAPSATEISDRIERFVDRLQAVDPNLPLRTIPLEIRTYGPVEPRLNEENRQAQDNQRAAIESWQRILTERFSSAERTQPITEVSLGCSATR
jgi:uncharacterized Fe-S cluster-containing radical SAM superfamily protein